MVILTMYVCNDMISLLNSVLVALMAVELTAVNKGPLGDGTACTG